MEFVHDRTLYDSGSKREATHAGMSSATDFPKNKTAFQSVSQTWEAKSVSKE